MISHEDITLNRLIVHMLDPRNPLGVFISEAEIPIKHNERLANHFKNYISNAVNDEVKKAARFLSMEDVVITTPSVCKGLLKQEVDFVEGSQNLARNLQAVLESDKRISRGNLVVCSFKRKDIPTIEYLALMKVDPSQVLRPKSEADVHGRRLVTFEIDGQVLPSSEQKLQKCALIHPEGTEKEFDLWLIDRQTGGIAQFFTEKFLGVNLAFDSRTQTQRFYSITDTAIKHLEKSDLIDESEAVTMRQAVVQALSAPSLSISDWIEGLGLTNEEAKVELSNIIRKKVPNNQFEIDTKFAEEKLIQMQRFVGDSDLYLELRRQESERMLSEEESDRPGFRKIVIYTKRWSEIAQRPPR